MTMATSTTPTNQVLRKKANWRTLHFYQKADTLYQLTVVFCKRFLPPYGDRTVDQMIQAARSGKQNIVEGCEDGMTSTYLQYLERRFVTEGGIKERMHAARTGYRQQQDQRMQSMQRELEQLRQALQQKDAEIQRLREIISLS